MLHSIKSIIFKLLLKPASSHVLYTFMVHNDKEVNVYCYFEILYLQF